MGQLSYGEQQSFDQQIWKKIEAAQPVISDLMLMNGARFVSACIPDRIPMASVAIHFDAGSRHEKEGEFGSLHFFEHLPPSSFRLANQGTTITQFAEQRQWGLTIGINAESLSFGFTCPDFDAGEAMKVIRDILTNPEEFYRQVFPIEKGRILNEIQLENASKGRRVHQFVSDLVMSGTGYAHPSYGYAEQVRDFSFDQVMAMGRPFLSPEHATVAISSSAEVISQAVRFFDDMSFPSAGRVTDMAKMESRPDWETLPAVSRNACHVIPAVVGQIIFNVSGEAGFRDEIVLDLLTRAYGNLLQDTLSHQHGLTYSAGSSYYRFGRVLVPHSTFNCSPEHVPEARAIATELLETFKDRLSLQMIDDEILALRNSAYLSIGENDHARMLRDMSTDPENVPSTVVDRVRVLRALKVEDLRQGVEGLMNRSDIRILLHGSEAALDAVHDSDL